MFFPSHEYNSYKQLISNCFTEDSHPVCLKDDRKWHNRFVLVLFTNRSGSNYLADLIASFLSIPLYSEALSIEAIMQAQSSRHFASLHEYFYDYINPFEPKVVKLSSGQLRILVEAGIINLCDMSTGHMKVIESIRRDVHRQAVSNYVASMTSCWESGDTNTGSNPIYDFGKILSQLHEIQVREANARILIDCHSPGYVQVVYEDLVKDPLLEIRRAVNEVGVTGWDNETNRLVPTRYHTRPTSNDAWVNLYTEIFKADIHANMLRQEN